MAAVHLVPTLSDNYSYVLAGGAVSCVVDPGEAAPVAAALGRLARAPDFILVTHHHDDHVGGVPELKRAYPQARVVACAADAHRMPMPVDIPVDPGSSVDLGGLAVDVIDTGGHTQNHVAFHVPALAAVFTGDALFSLGCGRLFEGTAEQMHASLERIAALPPSTLVYCGHEYTAANAKFAVTVDAHNAALKARVEEVAALRAADKPTVPTTIELERATNPFLRAGDSALQQVCGASSAVACFAEIRKRKDRF